MKKIKLLYAFIFPAIFILPFTTHAALPFADSQAIVANQDTSKSIILSGYDADNDPLTYAIISGPSSGVLTGTAPNVTYTPNISFTGSDSFSFKVNDGQDDSRTSATVNINVLAAKWTPVVWTDIVGVSVDGNTITKTASAKWGSGGAASDVSFNGDGGVAFVTPSYDVMGGLSTINKDAHYNTIEFALAILYTAKLIFIFEDGVQMRNPSESSYISYEFGVYEAGDVLSVERQGNSILYKKNGNLLYTSTKTTTSPLLIDAAIDDIGRVISDVHISGDIPPPYQCSDGTDNDSDGLWDFDGAGVSAPDPGCTNSSDNDEFNQASITSGDLNGDGFVNMADWNIMLAAWFTNNATADLNGDGIVNSLDFSILNSNWN